MKAIRDGLNDREFGLGLCQSIVVPQAYVDPPHTHKHVHTIHCMQISTEI